MADIDVTLPADGVPVDKAAERAFKISVHGRINAMPESWGGAAGALVAVKADGSGPGLPDGRLTGLNRPLANVRPNPVTITSSTTLNTNDHAASLLDCSGGSAVTLTLALGSNAGTSLQAPFACTIYRRAAAGSVTLGIDPSLSVDNTTLRKVSAGGLVTVLLTGTNVLVLKGDLEA